MSIYNKQFTWSNGHENPTYEKLDKLVISPDWKDIYALDRILSNHTRLL